MIIFLGEINTGGKTEWNKTTVKLRTRKTIELENDLNKLHGKELDN